MFARSFRILSAPLRGLFVLSVGLMAQGGQPNVRNAAFGIGGLPATATWPLAQDVPMGTATTVDVVGNRNVPFRLAAQSLLLNPGTPVLGNQILHVVPSVALDLFEAFPGFAVTNSNGQFSLPVTPGGFPVGSPLGLQAALFDPTTGPGITLSGAIQVTFTQGVIVRELQMGNQTSTQVNFATEGLPNFPFYEQTWSSMFINSDGNITFQSGSGDFTPTPNEFHSMQPRIAPWWLDLDPTLAGANGGVRLTIDPNGGATNAGSLNVRWYNLPVWQGRGLRHTFETTLDFGDGGIELIHDPRNSAAIYDALSGISPGRNQRPAGFNTYAPYTDFTAFTAALPKAGMPRESFWEWYGLPAMPFYTQSFANPYDLTGRIVVFQALGAGAPNGFYLNWTL